MSNQIEVKEPIKLLNKDGSLAQPGWARRNIIEYNREDITAPKLRIKEWDFYQVGCRDYCIQYNFFNISMASAATVGFLDMKTGEFITDMILDIGTVNRFQVNRNGEKPYVFERTKGNKTLKFTVTNEKRTLYWKSPKIEAEFVLDNYTGESIVIMNPFKKLKNRFFFTEKINCMPARGFVKYGGKTIECNRPDLYGVLDWGRGPWEHKNYWFWGNGTKVHDGKLLGFEITWGIGDDSYGSETAIIYDGVCHKLGRVDVEYQPDGRWMDPWKFHEENGRFEMTMTPLYDHATGAIVGPVGMKTHQVHGIWNGTMTLDDGTVLKVEDMYAFCEKVYNKW